MEIRWIMSAYQSALIGCNMQLGKYVILKMTVIQPSVTVTSKYSSEQYGNPKWINKQCIVNVNLLLEIPRLTDLEPNFKFSSFSLGYDISLQRLKSRVHSLIVQRRMTLRMGIKEEEITFIKKFRFPPSFWSCARRTFMLMKCINKVLKLSRSSLAHVSELENFQTRQLQSPWVPLKRDDLGDGLPLI